LTNIGNIFRGKKDGKDRTYYVYNVCNHEECYKEVSSQAISYTTGVPAMIGAAMVLTGEWKKPGVFNVEEMNPDPFMDALNKFGLPWVEDFKKMGLDINTWTVNDEKTMKYLIDMGVDAIIGNYPDLTSKVLKS